MRGHCVRSRNRLGFTAAAIALLVYSLTANRSVTFTDSGELAAVSATLGIAHPTGYPLFTIVGNLWSKIPIPFSPVRKLNLFAAFCTAVSVFLFYKIMLVLLDGICQGAAVSKSTRKGARRADGLAAVAPLDSSQRHCFTALWTALAYAFARTVWEQATSTEVYSLHLVMLQASILLFLRADRPRRFLLWAFFLGLAF